MKKLMLVIIPIAVAMISAVVLITQPLLLGDGLVKNESKYINYNQILKQKLADNQIQMSSPIKLSKSDDIGKYCSFFKSEEKQKLVQYCTSTELKDQSGVFLGNIHMVGTREEPKIILALIQTDKSERQLGLVKTVFATVSDNIVCNCWSDKKPGGLVDIGQWVDGIYQFHHSDSKPHSKSQPISLAGKSMDLEITSNDDGYMWQLFVYS